jgi:tetratricopeptide (TPR) repeat protein
MKRFLPLFFVICQAVGAQSWILMNQGNYEIHSAADRPSTALLAAELEQRFETYNGLFHFEPAKLQSSLKVRYFIDEGEYKKYISSRVREENSTVEGGAVYLHYSAPERRELVVLKGAEGTMLPYQAFIQFFRAFVPNPPSWMREGFAVYFNTLTFNADTRTLNYEENIAWLETVKKQLPAVSPRSVLLADSADVPDNFQALSWSLVSFFLRNRESSYFRTLTDSFMLLKSDASAEVNSKIVYDRLSLFISIDAFESDYKTYISSRKTFTELVEEGQKAYEAKELTTAADLFREAVLLKPDSSVPFFYLGLIAYAEKNYDAAERWYVTALNLGENPGLVQYARGVNAAAAGRKADAEKFLQEAVAASPEKYKVLAEDLMTRLR